MSIMLSKTDYMLGRKCPKALWLLKHYPEIIPDIDTMTRRRFDIGNEVQEIARQLFPTGKMIGNKDIEYAAAKTKELSEQNDVLFEATAVIPGKAFCRIDIMERIGDAWNLIEIKSATRVKEKDRDSSNYIDDLSFQKYVFENAGYTIKHCEVIYLNNKYTRYGELDINKLFIREDVSSKVSKIYDDVARNIDMFQQTLEQEEPNVLQHKTPPCEKCEFKAYCRKSLPEYPAFYLFHQDRSWQKFYNRYQTYNPEDIPHDYKLGDNAMIDRAAYLTKQVHAEPQNIIDWLNKLKYPLYYLDYETAQPAIPLFDNSNPYNQIPFQYSLHIQEKQGENPKHISFLHKERSDPRRALAECLVNNLGTTGSVIVYNKKFEKTRNEELAKIFPDLSDKILAINERIADQYDIFDKRYLYSPKQKSSSSIKYVLPAFSDISYQGMEIANGGEAMSEYEAFLKDKQTPEETAKMFEALEKYCEQDTWAMVVLMKVLYQHAEG